MSYHNQHESGELIGRVAHDTGQLQHFLIDGLPWLLVNAVSLFVIGGMLFALDPVLALAVLIPVPVFIVGSAFFHRGITAWMHRMGNRMARMHSLLGESIRGVRAVKAARQEGRRARDFDALNGELVSAQIGGERTWLLFMESATLAMAAGTVVVWATGAHRVLGGETSLGTLVAFIGYMAMFYGPLQWFAFIINWFARAMTGAERIFQVLDQPEEDAGGGAPFAARALTVRFEGVHFSYERGRAVLRGLDLDVPAGTMLGLVGKSGGGKSTTINLLCRFFTPDAGRITVNGIDLATLDLNAWRGHIGLVPQEPFLFHASILDNIRYAKPDASFADIVAAARAAHAHEFILKKARRLRRAGGRRRHHALGRRTPAHRHRARHPRRSAAADPRRGDLGRGQRDRAGDPGRHRPPGARPHHDRHRASPGDAAPGRSPRRDRRRQGGRERHACGTAGQT